MMIQDYSNWHQYLRDTSIHLLNFHDSLWKLSKDQTSFDKKIITDASEVNTLNFKVLLGSSIEYATRALCLSRQIDILLPPKVQKSKFGDFNIINVSAKTNPWLQKLFDEYEVKTVDDINTKNFFTCLNLLRQTFADEEDSLKIVDCIDSWRQMHRNTDAHISLKIHSLDLYDKIRTPFNALLSLVK